MPDNSKKNNKNKIKNRTEVKDVNQLLFFYVLILVFFGGGKVSRLNSVLTFGSFWPLQPVMSEANLQQEQLYLGLDR